MGKVDWFFWVQYGVPLVAGLIGGWWLRGVKVLDDLEREREWCDELWIAKRNHPAFRQQWEWDQ